MIRKDSTEPSIAQTFPSQTTLRIHSSTSTFSALSRPYHLYYLHKRVEKLPCVSKQRRGFGVALMSKPSFLGDPPRLVTNRSVYYVNEMRPPNFFLETLLSSTPSHFDRKMKRVKALDKRTRAPETYLIKDSTNSRLLTNA